MGGPAPAAQARQQQPLIVKQQPVTPKRKTVGGYLDMPVSGSSTTMLGNDATARGTFLGAY